MRDKPVQLTTPCPRCGAPITWALRDWDDCEAAEVRRAGCTCWLTRDQWADMAELANTLLDASQRVR